MNENAYLRQEPMIGNSYQTKDWLQIDDHFPEVSLDYVQTKLYKLFKNILKDDVILFLTW